MLLSFLVQNMSKLETLESPMIFRIRLTPSHFYLIQQHTLKNDESISIHISVDGRNMDIPDIHVD